MKIKWLLWFVLSLFLVSCIDEKENSLDSETPILYFSADSEFSQNGTALLSFSLSTTSQEEVEISLGIREESNSGYTGLPTSYITIPSSVIIKPGETTASGVVSIESLPIEGNLFQACVYLAQVSNARFEDNAQKVYISVDKHKFIFDNLGIKEGNNTDVYVISELKETQHVKSISGNGTIVFSESKLLEYIPAGSIICSGPVENAPNGYLYKVKSIHTEQGETLIETEAASLDEAIKDGHVNETLDILDFIDFVEDDLGNILDISYADVDTRMDITPALVIPIKVPIAGCVGVTGSLQLLGTSHFDLDISDWSVNKFEIWMEPGIKLQTSFGLELKGTVPITTFKLATIHMQPITFVVAGIPVVITQKVEVNITVSESGTIKLGCDLLDADIKYKAGIQYHRESGWDVISENTSSKPVFLKKYNYFDMNGELSIDLPQFSYVPALYGITTDDNRISENISFPISLKISDFSVADFTENYYNPRIKATWGVSYRTEARLTILSKKIIDYKSPIIKSEVTLLDKHLYPGFTIERVNYITPNTTEVVWNLTDKDDCFFKTFDDVGIYWKKGEWPAKMKDGTEQKKSYGGITLTSELLSRTYSHRITDLEPDHQYSARPYFVDEFGMEHLGNEATLRRSLCPDDNHPHAIDLGLGTKWACCNVRASSPKELGFSFAWGETTPKPYSSGDDFDYKWYYVTYYPDGVWRERYITKYCSNPMYGYDGFCDYKTTLELVDDAAHVNLGGKWRMPTINEFMDLINNCSLTYIEDDGDLGSGCIFTSKITHNSVFLPTKHWNDGNNEGCSADYWSSSLDELYHDPFLAYAIYIGNYERSIQGLFPPEGSDTFWYSGPRTQAFLVRPVQ